MERLCLIPPYFPFSGLSVFPLLQEEDEEEEEEYYEGILFCNTDDGDHEDAVIEDEPIFDEDDEG